MPKRSTKWYRKNESEVMHRLGLKPTKNSGSGWIEKCDGESRHFLCELKSTDHESFSIKQSVLHIFIIMGKRKISDYIHQQLMQQKQGIRLQ